MINGETDKPTQERLLLNIPKIKSAWNQKLKEGAAEYDPSNASIKKVGAYRVKYLPGRLQYLKDTAPVPFTHIDRPHDPQDVFCRLKEDMNQKQKILDLNVQNFRWDLLINNNPIESFHAMLIPQGEPSNQLLQPEQLEDLQMLAVANPSITLGFNTFGAAASQNHFHTHLFFTDWSIKDIAKIPIANRQFEIEDGAAINEYLAHLKNANTPYNLAMTKDGVIITPRNREHIEGIKFGVDAISGRFLTTSIDQFNNINEQQIEEILKKIGF